MPERQPIKHYAVRYRDGSSKILKGRWDDLADQILGHKGAAFKGFKYVDEAREWIEKNAIPFRTKRTPHRRDQHYLYVDGSFSQKTGRSGWGYVLIRNGNAIKENFGSCDNSSGSRNIIGEVYGTLEGVNYCVSNRISPIIVVHDYAGIGLWALGHWTARKPVAQNYQRAIQCYMRQIEISFEKVNGHCGIHWNDYVDELSRMYMSTGR